MKTELLFTARNFLGTLYETRREVDEGVNL